jgi:hypothetical protein
MYINENGLIYKSQQIGSSDIKELIGNEKQYSLIETSNQKIYQWQVFNMTKGCYEDDTTNTIQIEGITPVKGKAVIEKPPDVIKEPVDEEKIAMAESIIELTNQIDNLQSQINKLNGGN